MAADELMPLSQLDPAEAWRPWKPDGAKAWDLRWAGHLFRRAAFAANWSELQAGLRAGPDATLQKLFAPPPGQDDFDQLMDTLGPEANQPQQSREGADPLQGWWLYRMSMTRFPLRERLALFWHNHFATSVAKVQRPDLMKQQNILIRKHSLGHFGPFLLEMSRDPAMLLWLDSNSNIRGKPNENYARELMELFTMGTGHYAESDVLAAARAFTGWHTDGRAFRFSGFQHDADGKTFLGQTGNWDGGDIVRIILEQPATARFLVRKMYRHLISEAESPPDRFLEPLAERFRQSNYDVEDLVRAMLGSRHFFSPYALRQRIKSPAEFVIGLLHALEGKMQAGPAFSLLTLAMKDLGQTLFAPPTVKGWDGGPSWLNSATLLSRHNTAWRFVRRDDTPLGKAIDPPSLMRKNVRGHEYGTQVEFLLNLLLQPAPNEFLSAREKLCQFLAKDKPRGVTLERRLRETTHAIMLMPEYQLS